MCGRDCTGEIYDELRGCKLCQLVLLFDECAITDMTVFSEEHQLAPNTNPTINFFRASIQGKEFALDEDIFEHTFNFVRDNKPWPKALRKQRAFVNQHRPAPITSIVDARRHDDFQYTLSVNSFWQLLRNLGVARMKLLLENLGLHKTYKIGGGGESSFAHDCARNNIFVLFILAYIDLNVPLVENKTFLQLYEEIAAQDGAVIRLRNISAVDFYPPDDFYDNANVTGCTFPRDVNRFFLALMFKDGPLLARMQSSRTLPRQHISWRDLFLKLEQSVITEDFHISPDICGFCSKRITVCGQCILKNLAMAFIQNNLFEAKRLIDEIIKRFSPNKTRADSFTRDLFDIYPSLSGFDDEDCLSSDAILKNEVSFLEYTSTVKRQPMHKILKCSVVVYARTREAMKLAKKSKIINPIPFTYYDTTIVKNKAAIPCALLEHVVNDWFNFSDPRVPLPHRASAFNYLLYALSIDDFNLFKDLLFEDERRTKHFFVPTLTHIRTQLANLPIQAEGNNKEVQRLQQYLLCCNAASTLAFADRSVHVYPQNFREKVFQYMLNHLARSVQEKQLLPRLPMEIHLLILKELRSELPLYSTEPVEELYDPSDSESSQESVADNESDENAESEEDD